MNNIFTKSLITVLIVATTILSSFPFEWADPKTIPHTSTIVNNSENVRPYKKKDGKLCIAWKDDTRSNILNTAYMDSDAMKRKVEEVPEDFWDPAIVAFSDTEPVYFFVTETRDGEKYHVNSKYLYDGTIYNPDNILGVRNSTEPWWQCIEIEGTMWTLLATQGEMKMQKLVAYSRDMTNATPFESSAPMETIRSDRKYPYVLRAANWNGNPCILCRPWMSRLNYSLFYRDHSSGTWKEIDSGVVKPDDAYRGKVIDIAAHKENLYLAWMEKCSTIYLKQFKMNEDGSVCDSLNVIKYDKPQDDSGYFRAISIDVDKDGNPYIAFLYHHWHHNIYLLGLDDKKELKKEMVREGLPETPWWWTNQYQFINLAFNSGNNPTVLYYDYNATLLGYISGKKQEKVAKNGKNAATNTTPEMVVRED